MFFAHHGTGGVDTIVGAAWQSFAKCGANVHTFIDINRWAFIGRGGWVADQTGESTSPSACFHVAVAVSIHSSISVGKRSLVAVLGYRAVRRHLGRSSHVWLLFVARPLTSLGGHSMAAMRPLNTCTV